MKSSRIPTVSIIMPNYNGRAVVEECLTSLKAMAYPKNKVETIMVDNHSSDDSVEFVKTRFPWVKVLALERGYGLAGALNRGAQISKADYLLLINNDIVADRSVLKYLVQTAQMQSDVGAVGPMAFTYHDRSLIEKAWGKMDLSSLEIESVGRGEKDTGQYDQVELVDACIFITVLVPRDVYMRIGPLNERFFIYYEDNDFFFRLRAAGLKCYLAAGAKIWHMGSKLSGPSSPQTIYYLSRNKLLFQSTLRAFSVAEHLRNARFFGSSLLLSVLRQKEKKEHLSVALGIIDYYRGKFGERTLRFTT